MQILLRVGVLPVHDEADMQVVAGGIAGGAHLGDRVVLADRLPHTHEQPAAMGVQRTDSAAVVDDQIVAVAGRSGGRDDRPTLHRQNRGAVAIGDVQAIVVGGVLAGQAHVWPFAKA